MYKKAHGVVIPTKYEAGSFPLIESIFLQIPVICSNVTSLPETIGNSDFTFDPRNENEIIDKLEKIYFDSSYRSASQMNASSRRRSIIETGALETFLKCYRKLTAL